MDYLISAYKDGQELRGSDCQTIVRDAKTMIKVNNRLKWFKPMKAYDSIRIYSFTSIYNPDSYKLIKTIPHEKISSI